MKMKEVMKYTTPKLRIIGFCAPAVICTSGDEEQPRGAATREEFSETELDW